MTVAEVVAHALECRLWYCHDLSAGPEELDTLEIKVKTDVPPARLVRAIRNAGTMLGAVLDAHPPEARGWAPDASPDRSGFAGSGCIELLIHGDDAARGLGLSYEPDRVLAGRVLARLFPWVTGDEDPWALLRWATGRIALPDRPQLERWHGHYDPLDEWNGTTPPSRPSPPGG